MKASHDSLDALILAAASLKQSKTECVTKEGLEFVFTLMYLSRYTLSYGLADLLEKSPASTILNIAAPGRKGEVDWDALERGGKGLGGSPQFQSSRLNDLLGVSFSERERSFKDAIRYVLFNPWAVRSKGALNSYNSPVMRLITRIIYALIGQSVDEAIVPMVKLIDDPPADTLSAFIKTKPVDLSMATFDSAKVCHLDEATRRLLRETAGL